MPLSDNIKKELEYLEDLLALFRYTGSTARPLRTEEEYEAKVAAGKKIKFAEGGAH